jgi:hypothetical protein
VQPEGKRALEKSRVDERIILKWILKKYEKDKRKGRT